GLLAIGAPLIVGSNMDFTSYFATLRLLAHEVGVGYSGFPPEFNPVAIAIVVHATYCLIKLSLRGDQEFVFQDAFRAAVCTMLLIWFVYYVNRPNSTYLPSLFMLYGFLVVDTMRTFIIQMKRSVRSFEPPVIVVLLLATVIVPQIFA